MHRVYRLVVGFAEAQTDWQEVDSEKKTVGKGQRQYKWKIGWFL